MRAAISCCCDFIFFGSAWNQAAASEIDISAVSPMCLPPILTASASGLRRLPSQASHLEEAW
jgi:hypothetical protein